MLSADEATTALKEKYPASTINAFIKYGELFVFNLSFPNDGGMTFDPFYSVDQNTGEVKEFSILTDGDITEVTALFADAL